MPRVRRLLKPAELAFFITPRTWEAIEARFPRERGEDFRDAIIYADSDGGKAWIQWYQAKKAWYLTDEGRRFIGPKLVKKAEQWAALEGLILGFMKVLVIVKAHTKRPPRRTSFLCTVCGTRSLGAKRCLDCSPLTEAEIAANLREEADGVSSTE